MHTERLNRLNMLLMGVLFIGLGIFVLNTSTLILSALTYIFGIVFVLNGISKFIILVFRKQKKREKEISFANVLINLVAGIVILSFPKMPISLFAIGFIFYSLALGLTHGINFIIMHNNKVKGKYKALISFVFYMSFVLFLSFSPYLHINVIMNVIACYFILYGSMYFKDLILEVTPISRKDNFKRHIRISLPVIFQALLPKFVLNGINQFLTPSDQKEIDARSDFSQYKVEEKADIEIYIHTSNRGFGKMGHVDLCIGDEFLTYGNYDSKSVRFFEMIGDGVLISAYKKDYIPFVIKDSEKTLICYGIKLGEKQKKQVIAQFDQLKKYLYPWKPPVFTGNEDPYAARLSNGCKGTAFYKFKKGKFKTYFVLSTNCVLLADNLVGKAGLDVLKINGIITPGAYYEYLEHEFASKNEMVIYKKIYN